jgi:hypothetical protein
VASTMNGGSGALAVPERNNYFYGKLLDVAQFEKEQGYFNRKRLLLNRLVLGSGVVCGLNVVADAGGLCIDPGVALDDWGREILVPQTVPIAALHLTDDKGTPVGGPLTGPVTVTICLAFAETPTDLVPVLVPDCDAPGGCAAATMREGFAVLVQETAATPPAPPTCPFPEFPLPADGALNSLLATLISGTTPPAAASPRVPLAQVTIDKAGGLSIDPAAGRRLVYGNTLLYELILCLADRVTQVAQGHILRYVSGDGQTARHGHPLDQPIIVEVVDGSGHPVNNVLVQFVVSAGHGGLGQKHLAPSLTVTTGPNGQAHTDWRLGTGLGRQTVLASAVGISFTVTFHATATS